MKLAPLSAVQPTEIEGGLSASLTSTPGVADLTVSESTGVETKTTLQVLIDARKLIEKPEDWVNHTPLGMDGPHCMATACCVAAPAGSSKHAVWKALSRAINGDFITDFNDRSTHAEVLAAFDRAIAAERAKEGAR